MSTPAIQQNDHLQPLPGYDSILLAVDSSDHSNHGILEAIGLAEIYGSKVTSAHVYAAKLHDQRFRQMEGGLPEQYREEEELERQRDVHDSLITKGLSIITDSYLDQVDELAKKSDIKVERCSLEGKNYRELVNEANSGKYDLMVLGALGLGAIKSSRIGTVCQRLSRRSKIDTLIIKRPGDALRNGPIVVAVDGSNKSYGGLLTALSLAQNWGCDIKIVAAFDPYYHYVAFNRIASVLSEEAGEVFKFQEQEKLHEDIIDSGLAKIYQGHLSVAQSIARDYGIEPETALLDGKPHDVIARYLRETKPSLLIMGTTGIHADADLDIGGNTEYLLNDAKCAVLLSQREHKPEIDRLADVTTSWTKEAEQRMTRVPSFVRPMAKMAILRYAQGKGHTVITESIVEEATAQLMPGHAEKAMGEIVEAYDAGKLKRKPNAKEIMAMRWHEDATALLLTVKDLSLRGNLSMRAEKRARTNGNREVRAEHIRPFLDDTVEIKAFQPGSDALKEHADALKQEKVGELHWQTAALARLMRVPEGFMRDSSKQRIEEYARDRGESAITLEIAEQGLAVARKAMESQMATTGDKPATAGGCPFAAAKGTSTAPSPVEWSDQAKAMLDRVPEGFCRDMTIKAAESIAGQGGEQKIEAHFIEQVMQTFQAGSEAASETLPWESAAKVRLEKVPEMIRGMLIKEIEGWATREGVTTITEAAVDAVKQKWQQQGAFHLDPSDPRNNK
ncbi:MAG: universal stress protein [Candidatus Polarisedimenticolaceae bacterium]|nr:universal stress protein [Candidatus Polarisedimenticolaceae bacterium]